jgi:hypothetical protein
MSDHIDFRTIPEFLPSLCIPRVFANINEQRIRRTLESLNLGVISRIDIVSKQGEKTNRVFIHFRNWFNNKNADIARERLLNGQDIKVIYDDPWFWKISAYKNISPRPPKRQHVTREDLDNELEIINPTIKNAILEPKPPASPKVKYQINESDVPIIDGIKYDINYINKLRVRRIIIREKDKEETK